MPRPEIEDTTLKRLNRWISREKMTNQVVGRKHSGMTVDKAINLLLDKVGVERDNDDFSLISK